MFFDLPIFDPGCGYYFTFCCQLICHDYVSTIIVMVATRFLTPMRRGHVFTQTVTSKCWCSFCVRRAFVILVEAKTGSDLKSVAARCYYLIHIHVSPQQLGPAQPVALDDVTRVLTGDGVKLDLSFDTLNCDGLVVFLGLVVPHR